MSSNLKRGTWTLPPEAPRALHPSGRVAWQHRRRVSPARDRAELAGELSEARRPLPAAGQRGGWRGSPLRAGRLDLPGARPRGPVCQRRASQLCVLRARCAPHRLVLRARSLSATATAPFPAAPSFLRSSSLRLHLVATGGHAHRPLKLELFADAPLTLRHLEVSINLPNPVCHRPHIETHFLSFHLFNYIKFFRFIATLILF